MDTCLRANKVHVEDFVYKYFINWQRLTVSNTVFKKWLHSYGVWATRKAEGKGSQVQGQSGNLVKLPPDLKGKRSAGLLSGGVAA